ncbi:hypothetical protein [Roseivivax lentus]|nr:hypothetical protein [Roseivivax lentus]
MTRRLLAAVGAISSAVLLSACVEDTGSGGSMGAMPSAEEQVCLQRVSQETNNGDVTLLGSSFSQAGTEVIVGVGPQMARWQCIAYSDGTTSRPMSLTNEGTL